MTPPLPRPSSPVADDPSTVRPGDTDSQDTVCPHCSESRELAKVKGCVKCLRCGFKFDCNGW